MNSIYCNFISKPDYTKMSFWPAWLDLNQGPLSETPFPQGTRFDLQNSIRINFPVNFAKLKWGVYKKKAFEQPEASTLCPHGNIIPHGDEFRSLIRKILKIFERSIRKNLWLLRSLYLHDDQFQTLQLWICDAYLLISERLSQLRESSSNENPTFLTLVDILSMWKN